MKMLEGGADVRKLEEAPEEDKPSTYRGYYITTNQMVYFDFSSFLRLSLQLMPRTQSIFTPLGFEFTAKT